ncbi:unnamed protein product [Arctia plantaginis]|uniref:Uncharacterized protein n=1 Tax=Arctia plantaginis TaxID=874455 RepID=A0A8S0ZUY0_ARCPL|nr:unnamed protein product [Arctia plantaginis]
MNFLENITFRRTRTKSDSNDVSIQQSNESRLDGTTNSLPEVSDDEDEVSKLKQQISKLQADLNSAHSEIETLALENNELRQSKEELIKKNELYKKLISSPTKFKINTPKRTEKVINKELNITKHKKNISQENSEIAKINDNNVNTDCNRTLFNKCNKSKINKRIEMHSSEKMKLSKICMLSTSKRNKLLSIARTEFNDYNICHYLMPGGGTAALLSGLKSKLVNYTMEDYCVIFISSEDFTTTKDYLELIYSLRNALQDITNTNLIICLPSFRCNTLANMYNWRIEHFNNLLYLDVTTHEYAHVLDTNLHLSYDHTMFNMRTGWINKSGLYAVFKDLHTLIRDLQAYEIEGTNTPTSSESNDHVRSDIKFFL